MRGELAHRDVRIVRIVAQDTILIRNVAKHACRVSRRAARDIRTHDAIKTALPCPAGPLHAAVTPALAARGGTADGLPVGHDAFGTERGHRDLFHIFANLQLGVGMQ